MIDFILYKVESMQIKDAMKKQKRGIHSGRPRPEYQKPQHRSKK